MPVRGVRGATTASANEREAVIRATKELLETIIEKNGIRSEDVALVYLASTRDLTAEFPSVAVRKGLKWTMVPLMDANSMARPDDIERCIRITLLWNTDKQQSEIEHVYLHEAKRLRPDLSQDA